MTGWPVLGEVPVGVLADRGVAAADVAAGQAQPQVHRCGALALTVRAALGRQGLDVRGCVAQVVAGATGRLGWQQQPFAGRLVAALDPVEHRLLEVQRAHHLVEHLVVGLSGVADAQHLRTLGTEHLQPNPPVRLARRLLRGVAAAQPLPHDVDPLLDPLAQRVHGLGVDLVGALVEVGASRRSPLPAGRSPPEARPRAGRVRAHRAGGPASGSEKPLQHQRAGRDDHGDEDQDLPLRGVLGQGEHRRQRDHPAHPGPGDDRRGAPGRHAAGAVGTGADQRGTAPGRPRSAAAARRWRARRGSTATICRAPRSERLTSATIHRTCRPISRKTEFSSRNWMVDQLTRSLSREEAFCTTGDRCPSSSPVDDDGEDAGGAQLLGGQVGHERGHERQGRVDDAVGRRPCGPARPARRRRPRRATPPTRGAGRSPSGHPADADVADRQRARWRSAGTPARSRR